MVRKVYDCQKLKPVTHDWYLMISEERERYNIQLSDEEIQQMSRGRFKKLVSESVDSYAFSKMIMIAKRQTKCQSILKTIDENNVCIQKYLISTELVKE